MFLPPYSPDFNPIEQVFAKLKALLRKAAASHFARALSSGGVPAPSICRYDMVPRFKLGEPARAPCGTNRARKAHGK